MVFIIFNILKERINKWGLQYPRLKKGNLIGWRGNKTDWVVLISWWRGKNTAKSTNCREGGV